MVDTDDVIQFKAAGHPLHPPVIACLLMVIPCIQWIPPQLPGCRKCIRRTSRYRNRQILFIQLEQLRIRPGICTIKFFRQMNLSLPYTMHNPQAMLFLLPDKYGTPYFPSIRSFWLFYMQALIL